MKPVLEHPEISTRIDTLVSMLTEEHWSIERKDKVRVAMCNLVLLGHGVGRKETYQIGMKDGLRLAIMALDGVRNSTGMNNLSGHEAYALALAKVEYLIRKSQDQIDRGEIGKTKQGEAA